MFGPILNALPIEPHVYLYGISPQLLPLQMQDTWLKERVFVSFIKKNKLEDEFCY
jgi:hypothetical protein